ncbi:heme exporter protein CcmD [Roseobacter sp. HKCCD9010]|nr:heme exporter protein CcmD [Fontisubflavum oceani]MBF9049673.1 heme exporter protein CcmD [Rhodobacterales bacterium HKCCD4356]NNV11673.1 heme exporter protein CcmD [Roseobacter sp. HKCCD7357]NNV15857.1 heme exporter protein CcmD [Roseobacter sp. HKCCD8768]NNV25317.1 heme exporter protein CcmD [Roseobacter sp. HKCCD8192]NNV29574.1 heme exporter protein CcmD [Roseobacter sp. HKCCD9061]NNV33847.1 heme exporter protein CcmD [Roseobacter sp. HKCCD9073]NNV38097.1 heme exporter protein CcmD [Ro
MMPDLGRYATEVLSAYAGSLALLILVVVVSIWQARRVQRRLNSVEERRGKST